MSKKKAAKLGKKSQKLLDDFNLYLLFDRGAQKDFLSSAINLKLQFDAFGSKKLELEMQKNELYRRENEVEINLNIEALKSCYINNLFDGEDVIDIFSEKDINLFLSRNGELDEFHKIFMDFNSIKFEKLPCYTIELIKIYFSRISTRCFEIEDDIKYNNMGFCKITNPDLIDLCRIFGNFNEIHISRYYPQLDNCGVNFISTKDVFVKQRVNLDEIFKNKKIMTSELDVLHFVANKGSEEDNLRSENFIVATQNSIPRVERFDLVKNESNDIVLSAIGTEFTFLLQAGSYSASDNFSKISVTNSHLNSDLNLGLCVLCIKSSVLHFQREKHKIFISALLKNGNKIAKSLKLILNEEIDEYFYIIINPEFSLLDRVYDVCMVSFGKKIDENNLSNVLYFSGLLEFLDVIFEKNGEIVKESANLLKFFKCIL
eukprot:NODE_330_length_10876_cov_0.359840.p3 type:complete len:431 gc:universal NODE_330_length_10876_cov_0.359840:3018-1726(-)